MLSTGPDVAVVGGGVAGLASAISLLREGLSVVVIERTDYRSPRVGEHLPPNVYQILRAVGMSELIESGRHATCPGIRSVWGANEPSDKDYIFHPYGQGLNLSRPVFDRHLASYAAGLGADVLLGARVLEIRRASRKWEITVARNREQSVIRTDFVIDATGRVAALARRFGAHLLVYDDLVGIVGRTIPSQVDNVSVFIEALETGWWYSAGLADGSIVATFLTDADLADLSKRGRRLHWRERLKDTAITGARSPVLADIDDLQVRAARTQRLVRVAGDGWLAVGDAAMSFDPLSSEGISKGLEWGARAASVAASYIQGDDSRLKIYQQDVERTFSGYLIMRYRYYGTEKRWPGSPFWARRQTVPAPVSMRG